MLHLESLARDVEQAFYDLHDAVVRDPQTARRALDWLRRRVPVGAVLRSPAAATSASAASTVTTAEIAAVRLGPLRPVAAQTRDVDQDATQAQAAPEDPQAIRPGQEVALARAGRSRAFPARHDAAMPLMDDGPTDDPPGRNLQTVWAELSADEAFELLESLKVWAEEIEDGHPGDFLRREARCR